MLHAVRQVRAVARPSGWRGLSKLVTDEHRATYERDGVVCLRNVLSHMWLGRLREGVEYNLAHPGPLCDEHVPPGQPGRFHDDQFLWRRSSTFRDFIFDSPAAALVKAMTGAKEVNLFYDQLFVKEPGTAKETAWHTDHSYWQLQGGSVCTVWAPLDEVPETTALKYVAGSHKWQLKHQIDSFSGDQQRYAGSKGELPPLPDIDAMEASGQAKVLKWHMQPGDVLVFHSYLVHGAPGNSSSAVRRRAYVTRWANDSVRFDSRLGTMHYTWVERGGGDLDCGLVSGARLTSGLHPVVPAVA